jgi:hypothetical protein
MVAQMKFTQCAPERVERSLRTLVSLIASCRRQGVYPSVYFVAVLQRIDTR